MFFRHPVWNDVLMRLKNIFSFLSDPQLQLQNCINFIFAVQITFPNDVKFHISIIFIRFIYVRHSWKLLNVGVGVDLLHRVMIVASIIWSLHSFLITPSYGYFKKDHYQDLVLGKICTKTNISLSLSEDFLHFSVKPKLQICAGVLGFWGFFSFFYFAAKKSSQQYKILRNRQNLMTMDFQFWFNSFQIFFGFVDQLRNFIVENYYENIGEEAAFWIWITFLTVMIFCK